MTERAQRNASFAFSLALVALVLSTFFPYESRHEALVKDGTQKLEVAAFVLFVLWVMPLAAVGATIFAYVRKRPPGLVAYVLALVPTVLGVISSGLAFVAGALEAKAGKAVFGAGLVLPVMAAMLIALSFRRQGWARWASVLAAGALAAQIGPIGAVMFPKSAGLSLGSLIAVVAVTAIGPVALWVLFAAGAPRAKAAVTARRTS